MTTSPLRPNGWPERLSLPLILLLALVLRLREALGAPFWYDELYSLEVPRRTWAGVLEVMRADVYPPLHFAMIWVWYHLVDSDLAIRALPIAFGLAGVAAAWALARAWFGRPAADLAALLLALHPWHIYVSQEGRPFSLLWLLLTLAALGAWRWSENGRGRDGALFVAAAALTLWTHYLGGLVLFAQFAWGVARFAREPRRLAAWCGLHVAVAVLFAPLLPLWWMQVHRTTNETWATVPQLADLADIARREAFGSPWMALVLLPLAALPLASRATRRAAGFALTIGPGAVLLLLVLARLGLRLYSPKYVFFALPAILGLAAAGATRLPRRALAAAAAGLLVLGAARGVTQWRPYPEAADLGAARSRLAPLVRPGDVVYHADTHTYLFGRRYLPAARHRLVLMGQPLPYNEGAQVVPDSVRAGADEPAAAAAAGARWFAMASRPGATDTRAAAALFTALGARPETLGVVRVWIAPAAAHR